MGLIYESVCVQCLFGTATMLQDIYCVNFRIPTLQLSGYHIT